MYTFPPMMVANSRKHHCRVRPYTREVLVLSTNLESQTKHYPLVFRNRRGNEARIKKTIDQGVGSTSGIRACALRNFDLGKMELENSQNNALAKLHMLKLGEYEMSINSIKVDLCPLTTARKVCKRMMTKPEILLLMALPNEHQLTFNQYVDAQYMFIVITARFGGNDATKKTQKALLKQQYENFNAISSESLDSIFNRLQRLSVRLISNSWCRYSSRGSKYDLYKNFKIVEQKVKRTVAANNDDKNLAFLTTSSPSSVLILLRFLCLFVCPTTTRAVSIVHEDLEQLALMGYATDSDKLTFQKGAFSPQWRFLIHNILHCLSPKKTAWEQFSSNIAAAVICLATNRKFNFSRMIFDHMVSNISSPHKFLMYPRFIQLCLDMQRHKLQQHTRLYSVPSLTMKVFSNMKRSTKGFSGQEVALFPTMLDATAPSPSPSRITSSPSPTPSPSPASSPSQPSPTHPSPTHPTPNQPSPTQLSPTQPGTEYHPPTPHDSPLHAVHSHGSEEGSLKLQELMNLVNTLSDRIGVLEADLLKTKKTYSSAYTKLILRVKKLESQIKIGKARKQTRVVISDDEAFEDDSSKQGRKLFNEEVQEKASTETELFIQEVTPTEVIQDQEGSGKASDEVSTAGLKKGTASEEVPTVSTAEVHLSTAGGTVTYSRRSAEKRSRQDKGKAILIEEEPKKKSKKELEQERLSYAEAIRLEEQMNEEQRAQIARDALQLHGKDPGGNLDYKLRRINSIRDSCLVALQNKQTEFERYKAFNDRTVDYDKLEHKLNEALGLLAQKEIDIKEGLKVKACEISIVKEKHDELVKQSLLTKSHYEGLVKEKTKVITDLKLKEDKDIDKMISMENQIKFLNEIVYKRSQSIQTIHMLAPKMAIHIKGRPSFAILGYLKKAQMRYHVCMLSHITIDLATDALR
ncbi:hypothetical protein Tco_0000581 [Tanacetum coccineum]